MTEEDLLFIFMADVPNRWYLDPEYRESVSKTLSFVCFKMEYYADLAAKKIILNSINYN